MLFSKSSKNISDGRTAENAQFKKKFAFFKILKKETKEEVLRIFIIFDYYEERRYEVPDPDIDEIIERRLVGSEEVFEKTSTIRYYDDT